MGADVGDVQHGVAKGLLLDAEAPLLQNAAFAVTGVGRENAGLMDSREALCCYAFSL